jgi:hypothetical protein
LLICPTPKAKYFLQRGWTNDGQTTEVICPSGKSVGLVIARSDSDEAIHLSLRLDGLLRYARNDGEFVIPGRAKHEPGIHNHHRDYGFRARAKWRVPE